MASFCHTIKSLPLPKPGKYIGKPSQSEFVIAIGNFKKVPVVGSLASCFAIHIQTGRPTSSSVKLYDKVYFPIIPEGTLSCRRPGSVPPLRRSTIDDALSPLLDPSAIPRRSASDTQSLQGFFGV